MGNANTKESRGDDSGRRGLHSALDAGVGSSTQSGRESSRRNRNTRHDLIDVLGRAARGSSSHVEHNEHKETKQEREARRLERERVARLQERERSMKEEHVDGGYLVTMGTYVGPEDFNKQIVRQLMIERKLAPFWRGLNDFDENWTEPQIIAAARGLPIPAAGETPPDELIPRPRSPASPTDEASSNINHLTVPIGGRSLSTTSEHSASNPGSALPSPGSAKGSSSPFKPTRGKAIAAVLGGGTSRNASSTEIAPREILLPNDPFVNGQPLEVFLYKNATECPICFLTYPPYLNHTRCCDQPICSECFVQIKRPDPHFPEGHNENDPNNNPEESAGLLVSEPACCPYCTQPDFGVTYEPPPFRRGLTYAISPVALGGTSAAMSSESSVNSGSLSPDVTSPGGRRRNKSLSANAPNVVLTDKVRPEWANKLQAARAHLARRAAAATALHTAAFLMNNSESRLRSRFGRRNTGGSGSASATPGNGDDNRGASPATPANAGATTNTDRAAGSGGNGNRRSRLEDLEEMMFAEAIRLSLAAEEERKKKAEKEEQKEAKKREKEREKVEKKAEKAAAKAAAKQGGPYEASRSGHSSASGSSLSLPGLSFGRKRGNSAASNLRVEASVASAMASTGTAMSSPAAPGALAPDSNTKDKGKGVDRSAGAANNDASASTSPVRPIPSPQPTVGPSHLRQMSSASSVSSSAVESNQGSYVPPSNLQDPRGSGLSLGGRSGVSEDGDEQDRDPSTSTEPLFNFRSLAEVVGVSIEGEHAGKRLSQINADAHPIEGQDESAKSGECAGEHVEHVFDSQTTGLSGQDSEMNSQPPRFTVTLDSPATSVEDVSTTSDSKHVGNETTVEHARQVTQ
ncbi:SNF1-interacting protein [Neurospora sp. IMI 360204]|nr:SNF1-interacting protein [Neurospora sp. IMI 360204]